MATITVVKLAPTRSKESEEKESHAIFPKKSCAPKAVAHKCVKPGNGGITNECKTQPSAPRKTSETKPAEKPTRKNIAPEDVSMKP